MQLQSQKFYKIKTVKYNQMIIKLLNSNDV